MGNATMAKGKKMQLGQISFRLMTERFFNEMGQLDEFTKKSDRAHGIMLIKISTSEKLIAIPLRSSLKKTQKNKPYIIAYEIYDKIDSSKSTTSKALKGLDMSKLLFIEEEHVDFTKVFKTNDAAEQQYYRDHYGQIYRRVTNYITKYQKQCNDFSNLNEAAKKSFYYSYRFSTLVNFHEELKINTSKDEIQTFFKEFDPS